MAYNPVIPFGKKRRSLVSEAASRIKLKQELPHNKFITLMFSISDNSCHI